MDDRQKRDRALKEYMQKVKELRAQSASSSQPSTSADAPEDKDGPPLKASSAPKAAARSKELMQRHLRLYEQWCAEQPRRHTERQLRQERRLEEQERQLQAAKVSRVAPSMKGAIGETRSKAPASATFIPAPQPEANVWKVRQQSLSALTPFDSDDEEQMLREAIQKSLRDSGSSEGHEHPEEAEDDSESEFKPEEVQRTSSPIDVVDEPLARPSQLEERASALHQQEQEYSPGEADHQNESSHDSHSDDPGSPNCSEVNVVDTSPEQNQEVTSTSSDMHAVPSGPQSPVMPPMAIHADRPMLSENEPAETHASLPQQASPPRNIDPSFSPHSPNQPTITHHTHVHGSPFTFSNYLSMHQAMMMPHPYALVDSSYMVMASPPIRCIPLPLAGAIGYSPAVPIIGSPLPAGWHFLPQPAAQVAVLPGVQQEREDIPLDMTKKASNEADASACGQNDDPDVEAEEDRDGPLQAEASSGQEGTEESEIQVDVGEADSDVERVGASIGGIHLEKSFHTSPDPTNEEAGSADSATADAEHKGIPPTSVKREQGESSRDESPPKRSKYGPRGIAKALRDMERRSSQHEDENVEQDHEPKSHPPVPEASTSAGSRDKKRVSFGQVELKQMPGEHQWKGEAEGSVPRNTNKECRFGSKCKFGRECPYIHSGRDLRNTQSLDKYLPSPGDRSSPGPSNRTSRAPLKEKSGNPHHQYRL